MLSSSRNDGYLALGSEDESSGSGSTDSSLIASATIALPTQLDFYSRLIYFINRQQALAQSKLLKKADVHTPEQKTENKAKKTAYKNAAIGTVYTKTPEESIEINPVIAHSQNVFRGRSKFKDDLNQAGGIEKLAMGSGATFMDFIITFFRSAWQVLTNVLANYWDALSSNPTKSDEPIGNDDKDNPNSHYNQHMYNHNGDPASGLSLVGIGGVALALISPVLGIIRGIGQIIHKLILLSFSYLRKQKKEVNPDYKEQTDTELEEQLNTDLKDAMKKGILSVYLTFSQKEIASDRKTFIDNYLIDPIVQLSQSDTTAAKIFNFVTDAISTVWNRASSYSYVFWLAWMPVVMIAGLAAASGPLMPIVLAITLAVGTALPIGSYLLQKFGALKNSVPALSEIKSEMDRLAHETKVLNYIKEENTGIRTQLNIGKRKPGADYADANAQSNLKERLLGNIHERRGRIAVAGMRAFLGGLLTVIFVAWFGSALIGALGATTAAGFIGDVPFGGIGGGIAGIITSFISMAQMRKAQLDYEQRVETVLQASYRGTQETKEAAFQRLFAQVEHRKRLLLASGKINDKESEYLKNIDPFNPDLSKFRHEASLLSWTGVKKFLNRAFEFLFGGQTGAFTARFFLLKGALLTGAIGFTVFTSGAVLIPFLIAAAALIVLVGVLAVISYQMNANQAHREDMLNTLDARIYYLEKKNEELCGLQFKHDVDAQNAGTLEVTEELDGEPEVILTSQPIQHSRLLDSSDRNLPPPPVKEEDVRRPDESRDPAPVTGSLDAFYASGNNSPFFAPGKKLAQTRILPEHLETKGHTPTLAAPAA